MMFNYEYFRKKKILIFLPHQDDEINTVYGMIGNIKKVDGIVKVVYSTNGDYCVNAKYRIKEAINSLKIVNIKKDDIILWVIQIKHRKIIIIYIMRMLNGFHIIKLVIHIYLMEKNIILINIRTCYF